MFSYEAKTLRTFIRTQDSEGKDAFFDIGEITFARDISDGLGGMHVLVSFKNGKHLTLNTTAIKLWERICEHYKENK